MYQRVGSFGCSPSLLRILLFYLSINSILKTYIFCTIISKFPPIHSNPFFPSRSHSSHTPPLTNSSQKASLRGLFSSAHRQSFQRAKKKSPRINTHGGGDLTITSELRLLGTLGGALGRVLRLSLRPQIRIGREGSRNGRGFWDPRRESSGKLAQDTARRGEPMGLQHTSQPRGTPTLSC